MWNAGLTSLQDETLISSCDTASGLKNTPLGPILSYILNSQLLGGGVWCLLLHLTKQEWANCEAQQSPLLHGCKKTQSPVTEHPVKLGVQGPIVVVPGAQ